MVNSYIPTSKVVAGDILQVRAGEKIPVDGTITEGYLPAG